jgi:hypothetical protein
LWLLVLLVLLILLVLVLFRMPLLFGRWSFRWPITVCVLMGLSGSHARVGH